MNARTFRSGAVRSTSSGSRCAQGGGIAIIAAGTLALVIVCMALAVDTGRLYVEQRKLQKIADVTALEAVTFGGQCAAPGQNTAAAVSAFAEQAARRNDFLLNENQTIQSRLGGIQIASGLREFDASSADDDAVEVIARHRVPSSLVANLLALFPGSAFQPTVELTAEAVARRTPTAALWAGTGLLRLGTNDSPLLGPLLRGLLGTDVQLDLLSHQGVLPASITLLELMEGFRVAGVDLMVGTVDELLNARANLLQLVDAAIVALDRKTDQSQSVQADLHLLRQLGDQLRLGTGVTLPEVRLGDLLEVVGAAGAMREQALQVGLDAVGLVETAILFANSRNAIALDLSSGELLDNLTVTEGGTPYRPLNLNVGLYIVEPPRIVIGAPGPLVPRQGHQAWKTEIKSAQVRLNVGTEINLGLLANVVLGLAVTAGGGKAALESIQCSQRDDTRVSVLGKPALASIQLGNFSSLSTPSPTIEPARVTVLGTPHASLIKINLRASSVGSSSGDWVISSSDERAVFSAPFPAAPQTISGSSSQMLGGLIGSLTSSLRIQVELLGSSALSWLLEIIVAPVVMLLGVVLTPLITLLGSVVIDPLLALLGIDLDTVDISVLGVDTDSAELVR